MSSNYFTSKNYDNETVMGATVLVEDGIVWGQENFENVTLEDDMSESYVTAQEDDTEYFSILDSNETILGDMNIAINNSKIDPCNTPTNHLVTLPEPETEHLNLTDINLSDQQVLLYSMEGSDELYGIQMAEDENGVLQKYKFALRQNELGQLEAIPESIHVLPMDSDEFETELPEPEKNIVYENEENDEVVNEENINVPTLKIVVKDTSDEVILPDLPSPASLEENELQVEEEITFDEQMDTKQGILDMDVDSKAIVTTVEVCEEMPESPNNKKHEVFIEQPENINESYNEIYENETEEYEVDDEITEQESEEEMYMHHSVFDDVPEREENEKETLVFAEEESQDVIDNLPPDSIFETDTNDSDMEEYQIVDGLPVANTCDENEPENNKVDDKLVLQSKLLTTQEFNNIKNAKDVEYKKIMVTSEDNQTEKACYYIVDHSEKENVRKVNKVIRKTPKVNPRSILKSSHASLEETKKPPEPIERIEKRFANSKEVIQARLFHNYIAGTKIIHAPIRQERLPRKQKIKPVERQDEEIVVEEVVISSNGFVEPSEIRLPTSQPVACVNLADSDDDYDPKRLSQKKRRKRRKRGFKEIIISDSENEDSSGSIIDLASSSEEEENNKPKEEVVKAKRGRPKKSVSNKVSTVKAIPTVKRRRGRPPKVQRSAQESTEQDDTAQKTYETVNKKNEIGCSKCTRTFPSQGSLKTHMQYHNFRESRLRSQEIAKTEYKYKCNDCGETFKNNTLLSRHTTMHYKAECEVCKRKFKTKSDLLPHKKMHRKSNMLKNTSLITVTPKKIKQDKTHSKNSCKFTCKSCGKVFSTFILLEAHLKTHLHFACSGCFVTFASKPLLHAHQKQCIKRKAILQEIRRLLHGTPKVVPKKKRTSLKHSFACENCNVDFPTQKEFISHRARAHGFVLKKTATRTSPRKRKTNRPPDTTSKK